MLGINHKTAPLSLREQWGFNAHQTQQALENIKHHTPMHEAVILSTCNRTEIYTTASHQDTLRHWLETRAPEQFAVLNKHTYHHEGKSALAHLLRVASGLDSMIVGEPQIFGQLKQAYQRATEAGTVGNELRQLFPSIFAVSKTIRHTTDIAKHSISLAYIIIQLAQQVFSALSECHVLLVGTGEMTDAIAARLHHQTVKHLTIAGRNPEKTDPLANKHGATAIEIRHIPQHIEHVDIVISATASSLPIIGKGMIESALRKRKHKPMLLVDIAVPRDIEPELAELNHVYLYNMDDLEHLIAENMKHKDSAAKQAETLVTWHTEHVYNQLRSLDATALIKQYRQQTEQLRDQTLQSALDALGQGQAPELVLRNFAATLTNKIMHQPSTFLRQAAYDNNKEQLLLAKALLDL